MMTKKNCWKMENPKGVKECLTLENASSVKTCTVSGNRACITTVGVKPDCTGNVAIQILAGQVVCTGSERSRD